MQCIVGEEDECFERVAKHIRERPNKPEGPKRINYDQQLIDLRDQIGQARMEDVPPLLEQMERMQQLAARQGQSTVGHVDPNSPYFGRMVLREEDRVREVLIGRSTYLETQAGVRIVDWRDAPISRMFYRYQEGDDYEETFGGRDVEGEVVARRSLTIVDSVLKRIVTPQGVFLRPKKGDWRRGGQGLKLQGGQGSAIRAGHHHRPGKLGVGNDDAGEDRHLKAITALIDPRQFDLITKPDSGLVVIQGGAGSGKTTIGLHRLAYLAFQDRKRFRPDRMLVIAFNQALVRYISQILPALDVAGVGVRTYPEWAGRLRMSHFPWLPKLQAEDTPSVVTRLKKHPAMLKAIDGQVAQMAEQLEVRFVRSCAGDNELSQQVSRRWRSGRGRPLVHRLHGMSRWLLDTRVKGRALNGMQREIRRGISQAEDVVAAWSELITDLGALTKYTDLHAAGQFTTAELTRAHAWCSARSARVIADADQAQEEDVQPKAPRRSANDSGAQSATRHEAPMGQYFDATDTVDADEPAELDIEDDALLLKFYQCLRGPLRRPKGKEALSYEHILVDEAQDLSPVELSVLTQTVSGGQSMTLAGDVAQRLYMDNGFTSWNSLLSELGLSHVEVEPLEVIYRSTQEVMRVAQAVLGPLATGPTPRSMRQGAPVELFRFAHNGDAAGFVAEALRDLATDEPQASIAVVARYPEQADIYYAALERAEVPRIRRVADQDFPFKPGVDVTDIRQVKGLEFDYVVLVDVNHSTYPKEDDARHLLHIAVTRAAHQLWLVCTAAPSGLLPEDLRDREY